MAYQGVAKPKPRAPNTKSASAAFPTVVEVAAQGTRGVRGGTRGVWGGTGGTRVRISGVARV